MEQESPGQLASSTRCDCAARSAVDMHNVSVRVCVFLQVSGERELTTLCHMLSLYASPRLLTFTSPEPAAGGKLEKKYAKHAKTQNRLTKLKGKHNLATLQSKQDKV